MANTQQDVRNVAKTQVGYREGHDSSGWNNVEKYAAQVPGMAWVSDDHEPWCAIFVSWVYQTAGVVGYKASAAVAELRDYYKSQGRFTEYPVVGGTIIIGRNGDVHTGIVIGYDDTNVYTIEGNTNDDGSAEGNGVYKRTRVRTSSSIYGYGIPLFSDPLITPDPKFKNKVLGTPVKAAITKAVSTVRDLSKTNGKGRPISLSRTLQNLGQPNGNVKIIQNILNRNFKDQHIDEDGMYGPKTKALVARYQKVLGYSGSDADGVLGTDSFSHLVRWDGWSPVK